ncbi:MAG: FkbM family methyltransferase [Verrucomicrobia bacterium]|nr:FkbM family methyltransferase [Verrucomicrobiota bacterium]
MSRLKTSKTKFGEVTYFANDFYIAGCYDQGKVLDEEFIESTLAPHVKNAKIAVDCGGHIGSHTIVYKHINPGLVLHTFELQTPLYSVLKQNVEKLKLSDVFLYNCALGNKVTTVAVSDRIIDGPNANEVFNYDGVYNFGGVQVGKTGHEDKLMIPLDSLNLPGCDYIKIDVEGCELPVVVGALTTIVKYRPVVYYESNYKTMTDDMAQLTGIPKDDGSGVLKILSGLGYGFAPFGHNILAIPNP